MDLTGQLAGAQWRTSSYSGDNGGGCVAVAGNLPAIIAVRDSKDPAGPALAFGRDEWAEFLGRVKAGELDLT